MSKIISQNGRGILRSSQEMLNTIFRQIIPKETVPLLGSPSPEGRGGELPFLCNISLVYKPDQDWHLVRMKPTTNTTKSVVLVVEQNNWSPLEKRIGNALTVLENGIGKQIITMGSCLVHVDDAFCHFVFSYRALDEPSKDNVHSIVATVSQKLFADYSMPDIADPNPIEENGETDNLAIRIMAPISFIETLLYTYLERVGKCLNEDDEEIWPLISTSELKWKGEKNLINSFIRESMASFLMKIQQFSSKDADGVMYDHLEFDSILDKISSERYEGDEAKGKLLLVAKDNSIQTAFKLKHPFFMEGNTRRLRKLLEVSSEEMPLLYDGEKIFAFGTSNEHLIANERVCEVRFTKHHTWEVWHKGKPLFVVEYGKARLPKRQTFDEKGFEQCIIHLFKEEVDTELLSNVVKEAVKQRHGTMLIITTPEHAAKEAVRLAEQSMPLEKPLSLLDSTVKKVISHISGIDGAILLDTQGRVHSFAVILDGLAIEGKGDSARGARYNSAIRYIEADNSNKVLAVIISEDKSIDFYPNL